MGLGKGYGVMELSDVEGGRRQPKISYLPTPLHHLITAVFPSWPWLLVSDLEACAWGVGGGCVP